MSWFTNMFKSVRKKKNSANKTSKMSQIDRMTTMMARYSGSCLSQSEMARESWNKSDDAYYNQQKKR